jgi:uncharacterized membrane-anchored protein
MKFILSFIALIISTATPLTAFAEGNEAPELHWINGPSTVTIGENLAEIHIEENYTFLNKEDTILFNEYIGNPINGTEIGSIFPISEEESWFIVFEYDEVGHIKDDGSDEIDADSLLDSYRDGNEAYNEEAKEAGLPTMDIIGWDEKPAYDAETHNLTWGMIISFDGQETVNYNTRILTREGYISVVLVADPAELNRLKPELNTILTNLQVNDTEKYSAFNPNTDKVAQFGLAALIAGGAGAVAAKTGLIAAIIIFAKKFFVLIIAAIAGLGAFIRKRLKMKNNQES